MANDKKFFDYFKLYKPDSDVRRVLEDASELRVLVSKQPLRIEVHAFFPYIVRNAFLRAVENELREMYDAASFRILPKFPSELFSTEALEDVVEEAIFVNVITRGFLDEAIYEDDGETVTARVPFLNNAISFMSNSGTAEMLGRIIESRFGIKRRVKIIPSSDASERTKAREESHEAVLREADDRALEEFREMIRAKRTENAPVDEHPDFALQKKLFSTNEVLTKTSETTYTVGDMCFDCAGSEVLWGDAFDLDQVIAMNTIDSAGGTVVVMGEIFSAETKENFDATRVTLTVGFSDSSTSFTLKKNTPKEEASWMRGLKEGKCIAVKGTVSIDKFDGELVITPRAIMSLKRVRRGDPAEEKRVELHLHTVMSAMDAIIHPEEVVEVATRWGHKAIAVTDHGNVQAFPEVMLAAEKKNPDLKVIYGMEAYYVNDEPPAIPRLKTDSYEQTTVVFDLETTGFSAKACEIIEFGAVKIEKGKIVDRFSSFVRPLSAIPEEITKLTSITNEMVAEAPTIEEALPQFMEFIGDALLIAHNANFDTGFVRAAAERQGIAFENPYLDTVIISRYVNPSLKNHKLNTIADDYGFGDFNHHRAVDDAEVLAKIYTEMLARLAREGVRDYKGLSEALNTNSDPLTLKPYHMIILAKNQTGLKNLYEMISASYLRYYRRNPRIPRTEIEKHREGLIIGSACEAGELYRAILDNRSEEDLEKIASFYDYLEIQPLCNNMFLIGGKEGIKSVDQLMDINRKIIALGKKLGKPTVATCDAHFLEKTDEVYRKILLAGLKFADADKDTGIYLKNTEEMLNEFSYLGEDLAREVVIENPNKIADMVERLRPIPKGTYTPSIPGSEEELQRLCWERAMDWYGFEGKIPDIVTNRLNKELDSIIKHGFAVLYMIAQKLVAFSEKEGYLVGSRGSVGSSFVAIMSGISEVNPLPPHYRCTKCRYNEFITDGSYGSGFDLPDKACPNCGTMMYSDGQDIPFETFLGFHGDKSPDIDLNFSGDVQGRVHKYTEDLFGEGHVFRAGTLGTLASKTAFGYVKKYIEERKIKLPKAEESHIISRCVGVKRTTGQHPGGIIVVPREYDVHDFTPVQHPADKENSSVITTHFPFEFLHDTILKLDELGHDIPTKYKMLEEYTNTSVLDVKMNDGAVYKLFESTAPLKVTPEEIGAPLGTYGLPEFGTRFVLKMLEEAKPRSFADLLQISGLSHGTDVWTNNAQDLINDGICDISHVIGCRDNIMNDLIRYGLENALAFKIMEAVRKGKGLTPEWEEEMHKHEVPDWYIGSCKKIKYMFPKAHAAAYVMSAIRLGWYKIYYPMEFYAAFLSVAPGGFDAEIVMGGVDAINRTFKEIEDKGNEATQKDKEQVTTLLLVRECLARGIRFLPVDLYHSDTKKFLPEDGKIRMPFSSLAGLGEAAAESIVAARNEGEIFSIEDLKERAGLSKSVIELLRSCGALKGLSETNQLTFF